MLFDYNLIKLHRNFASDNLYKSDFLIQHAISIIKDQLDQLEWDFKKQKHVLELGARNGSMSQFFLNSGADLTITDLSQKMLSKNPSKKKILVNDDSLEFQDDSADLIISTMNLHWINDVRAFAKSIHRILKKDGAFIANFIGDNSFLALKKLIIKHEADSGIPHTPHIIPLIPAENIYILFQEAGFKFIIVNRENIELEYNSPIDLMKDLKNMGENNAMLSNPSKLPRSILSHSESFEDELIMVTLIVKKG